MKDEAIITALEMLDKRITNLGKLIQLQILRIDLLEEPNGERKQK
jgi:hypothetical protein